MWFSCMELVSVLLADTDIDTKKVERIKRSIHTLLGVDEQVCSSAEVSNSVTCLNLAEVAATVKYINLQNRQSWVISRSPSVLC